MKDGESDEPKYDLEGAILTIDEVRLGNLGYDDQTLKQSSFAATVFKIQKKF